MTTLAECIGKWVLLEYGRSIYEAKLLLKSPGGRVKLQFVESGNIDWLPGDVMVLEVLPASSATWAHGSTRSTGSFDTSPPRGRSLPNE